MQFGVDDLEAVVRLGAAVGLGMLIGLNRDLKGKPTGARTLGLVALGAALTALTAVRVEGLADHPDAMSRVVQGIIQGVLTGIGFVGAGVVLRDQKALEVHGLTTAAAVWVTAALGIACALASWHLIVIGGGAALVLLTVVQWVERGAEAALAGRRSGGAGGEAPD
ncbi:MgtC/SapB family protein [Xanthobacter sp. KR7-225]|uniref:MgtC/SapB family protein n=1 Tax=Xanthobacter sp. KR7-225 TaxID=3156613 RepID=UPI0032B386CC